MKCKLPAVASGDGDGVASVGQCRDASGQRPPIAPVAVFTLTREADPKTRRLVNRAANVQRRAFLRTMLACATIVGSLLATARPAHAAGAPLPSAGQRWALVSEANGLYVTSELNDAGGHAGMLRARAPGIGGWEKYRLAPIQYIFGGDLNLTPPDSPSGAVPGALGPVYDAYQECDQSAFGGLRKGTPTDGGSKIDYIFGPATAGYQCRVASEATDSDHKPIYARVALS